jgi:5-formyltetrahydrofolate cyclo-ligase
MNKSELRSLSRTRAEGLSAVQRAAASSVITERILTSRFWQESDGVFLFAAMAGREPSVAVLIRQALGEGKSAALPYIDPAGSDLMRFKLLPPDAYPKGLCSERHPFGFCQPDRKLPEISPGNFRNPLIIVPGTAFTPRGDRLGNGGGYYDRFLRDSGAAHAGGPVTVGVCFAVQIFQDIPMRSYDIPVMHVCTESAWYSR